MDTSLSIKEIMEDKTKEKEASHLKLKLNIINNTNFFNTRVFTKKDLFKLCSAYECPFPQSMKKETLSEMLTKCISSAHGMKIISVFSEPVASTSQESDACSASKKQTKRSKTPYKGTGKGKGKGSKKKWFCAKCTEEYHSDEEWIECSDCKKWLHRQCGSITDESEGQRLQQDDIEWVCPFCT